MAAANEQITSVSVESELRKLKEEEGMLNKVHQDEGHEEEEEEEEGEVEVREEVEEREKENGDDGEDEEEDEEDGEDEDEEDGEDEKDEDEEDGEDEENEVEDACVYDEYKDIDDVSDDIFSEDDPEEYRIYLRYAIKTEGFYVPFAPKDALGVVTPVGPCSSWWPKVAEGAELAVAHYNKNRAGPDGQLKLVSIRLANLRSVGGVLFYITFEAEHVASGDINDYQTKLFWGHDGSWEVLLIRKDPEAAAEMIQLDMPKLKAIIQNRNVH